MTTVSPFLRPNRVDERDRGSRSHRQCGRIGVTERRRLASQTTDRCRHELSKGAFAVVGLGGESKYLVSDAQALHARSDGFHRAREGETGDQRQAVLHHLLVQAGGEDRIHSVHTGSPDVDEYFAFLGFRLWKFLHRTRFTELTNRKRAQLKSPDALGGLTGGARVVSTDAVSSLLCVTT
jgi:hypothetical protein